MGIYKIDLEKCDGSPFCPVARVCPVQAVLPFKTTTGTRFPASLKYRINQDVCQSCGKCLNACPRRAVYQDG